MLAEQMALGKTEEEQLKKWVETYWYLIVYKAKIKNAKATQRFQDGNPWFTTFKPSFYLVLYTTELWLTRIPGAVIFVTQDESRWEVRYIEKWEWRCVWIVYLMTRADRRESKTYLDAPSLPPPSYAAWGSIIIHCSPFEGLELWWQYNTWHEHQILRPLSSGILLDLPRINNIYDCDTATQLRWRQSVAVSSWLR